MRPGACAALTLPRPRGDAAGQPASGAPRQYQGWLPPGSAARQWRMRAYAAPQALACCMRGEVGVTGTMRIGRRAVSWPGTIVRIRWGAGGGSRAPPANSFAARASGHPLSWRDRSVAAPPSWPTRPRRRGPPPFAPCLHCRSPAHVCPGVHLPLWCQGPLPCLLTSCVLQIQPCLSLCTFCLQALCRHPLAGVAHAVSPAAAGRMGCSVSLGLLQPLASSEPGRAACGG